MNYINQIYDLKQKLNNENHKYILLKEEYNQLYKDNQIKLNYIKQLQVELSKYKVNSINLNSSNINYNYNNLYNEIEKLRKKKEILINQLNNKDI